MRRICLVAWMAGCLGVASAQTLPPAKTPAPSEPKPMAVIVMPDFYFHLTIAYAILRHNGVALGKKVLPLQE